MDFELPGEDHPKRQAIRAWFDANPHPSGLALAQAGFVVPHWPKPWGLEADAELQLIIDQEMKRAGVHVPRNPVAINNCAQSLLTHGTEAQRQHFLWAALSGEHTWCMLFSEPSGGSDLGALRTVARRDGDHYVVKGHKIWTSLAHKAKVGVLVARTDPDQPKHKGLSYFVLDMTDPGVEVRPLRQMTGAAEFNEVYLHDARIPDTHRLGDVGQGWRVAMTTLMNERRAIGGGSSVRGSGSIGAALQLWRERPDLRTPTLRDRLTLLFATADAARLTGDRQRVQNGDRPIGPEGSIGKLVGAELNQEIYEFCMDMLGVEATLYGSYEPPVDAPPDHADSSDLPRAFLRSRANTIEGGTSEIMRNILGERVLGLPKEPQVDRDIPWKDVKRSG
jgi:3-oxochol-4-en-24-oyl-CoA dehydrogenase